MAIFIFLSQIDNDLLTLIFTKVVFHRFLDWFGIKVEVIYISLLNQIKILMKKKYIFTLLIIGFLFISETTFAQQSMSSYSSEVIKDIDGLSIYPNPVSNGIIYITSTLNKPKEIKIYDVLGKMAMSETILGKELDVSNLNPGVYILRIKENELSTTRKLVVR